MSRNGKGHIQRPLVKVTKKEFFSSWASTFAKCEECGSKENLSYIAKLDEHGNEIELVLCAQCEDAEPS